MTGQKFAIATLVGAVALFVGGFLIYGLALNSYMTANMTVTMKDPPDWLTLGLGQIAGGALLTLVIGKWAKASGAGAGLAIGAQLGLLMCLAFDLTMYATSSMMNNMTVMAVDVLAATVLWAIGGAAVGAMLGQRS